MGLKHVIYSSNFQDGLGQTDLQSILEKSRLNNQKNGLTGLLVYADGLFIQILEGESHRVDTTLRAIIQDYRHWNIHVLLNESIEKRSFPDWTMGFVQEDIHHLRDLLALEGTFDSQALNSRLTMMNDFPPLFIEYFTNKLRAGSNLG
ncbi:BLUF domain-containing protein [Magnetospira thiophila]